MAFKQAFTDASGNTCPDAYWRPAQINLGVADGNALVVFYGYKDADARTHGKQPLPGAVKTYGVSGQTFAALYAAHVAPGGPNIAQMVYGHAKAAKDVAVDPQDPSKNVSFFENAEDA